MHLSLIVAAALVNVAMGQVRTWYANDPQWNLPTQPTTMTPPTLATTPSPEVISCGSAFAGSIMGNCSSFVDAYNEGGPPHRCMSMVYDVVKGAKFKINAPPNLAYPVEILAITGDSMSWPGLYYLDASVILTASSSVLLENLSGPNVIFMAKNYENNMLPEEYQFNLCIM